MLNFDGHDDAVVTGLVERILVLAKVLACQRVNECVALVVGDIYDSAADLEVAIRFSRSMIDIATRGSRCTLRYFWRSVV